MRAYICGLLYFLSLPLSSAAAAEPDASRAPPEVAAVAEDDTDVNSPVEVPEETRQGSFDNLSGITPSAPSPAKAAGASEAGGGAPPEAPANGQPAVAGSAVVDPPARVGRLSAVVNKVSLRAAGTEAWTEATLNRPITRGDAVWTDSEARAEIHVGTLAIRLGPQTAVQISNLDDKTIQLSLTQGLLVLHVRELGATQLLEVDLPNAAVTLQKAGQYRFTYAAGTQTTEFSVRHGAAEVLSHGEAFAVAAGQATRVHGANPPQHEFTEVAALDAFDGWCVERDRRADHPTALRYVSRSTVGFEDLDDNGSWNETSEYGAVWVPTGVAVDWAPYHYGRWAWVAPWGWTWVDAAPWGFAPFHYGRWVYYNNAWGWTPGAYVARPYYSPALVAFAGGVGIGVGIGAVAWFALGPREPYFPAYGVSYNYVRQVNYNQVVINHTTNINALQARQVYANRTVPGAVAQVPRSVMQNAQPVAAHQMPVSPAQMASARVANSPGVTPQRNSIGGGAPSSNVAHPPAAAFNRAVTTQHPVEPLNRAATTPNRPAAPSPSRAAAPSPRAAPEVIHPSPGPRPAPSANSPSRAPTPHYAPAPHYAPEPHYAPPPHYAAPRPSFGGGHGGGGGGRRR